MPKISKEELAKLPPEERLKRLRELEEETKKEIKEAERLIKETEEEIKREKISESVAIPETRPINIGDIFKEEEGLESAVREEGVTEQPSEGEQTTLYQLIQDYNEAKEILYSQELIDEKKLEWLDELGERIEKARYVSTSDKIANIVVATRSLIYKIRKYHQQ